MSASDHERFTCPACNQRYRWRPDMSGKHVTCRKCDLGFFVPDAPGPGLREAEPAPAPEPTPQPDAEAKAEPQIEPEHLGDDGIYELDMDSLKDEPPATAVPPRRSTPQTPQADDPVDTAPTPPPPSAPAETTLADDLPEEPKYVDEATKARRREEARIAAAANEPARSWRDYKWLLILVGLTILFAIIYWGMSLFSDAMDKGLHNTMRQDSPAAIVST